MGTYPSTDVGRGRSLLSCDIDLVILRLGTRLFDVARARGASTSRPSARPRPPRAPVPRGRVAKVFAVEYRAAQTAKVIR